MKVLHHAFGHDNSGELPHHHDRDCVVYPATHDNDTTRGWWKSLPATSRKRFVRFAGSNAAQKPNEAMIRIAFESPAQLAIIPLQDILGLDRLARMNFPGTPKGNWCWRLGTDWHAQRNVRAKNLHALAALTGRIV